QLATTCRIVEMAFGTVIVISTIGIPPASMASTASSACCELFALTTGTMPTSPIRCKICSDVMACEVLHVKKVAGCRRPVGSRSARDASGLSFHQVLHLLQRGH